jgi:hypothetical protein
MLLTVFCPTARRNPRFQEMCDSLANAQARLPDGVSLEMVVVDEALWYDGAVERESELRKIVDGRFPLIHVPPKPCVWRGPHRLTQKDHWAKANAVNTAFVYAHGDHVIGIDDCSFVDEFFLTAHYHAAFHNLGAAGGYKYLAPGAQVQHGRLVEGQVTSDDHRLKERLATAPCPGGWLYGGNFSAPLSAVLDCNGYDEIMDGSGGLEDSEFGLRLSRVVPTWFYPSAAVYQLTDSHDAIGGFVSGAIAEATGAEESEKVAKKCKGFWYRDAAGTSHWFTYNHLPIWWLTGHRRATHPDGHSYTLHDPTMSHHKVRFRAIGNAYDLRDLRALVAKGEPLPVPKYPYKDWRDKQPLTDM